MKVCGLVALLSVAVARPADSDETYGPFKEDFVNFLKKDVSNYAYKSYLAYPKAGTFGGKGQRTEKLNHQPVVFVHGNSDSALDIGSEFSSGWNSMLDVFIGKWNYTFGELYGISWGLRDISQSFHTKFTCELLKGHRQFLQSVIDYSGADKIDVVGHSMGLTILRKIIKGGLVELVDESCELGGSLANKIDTLVGVASANYGMCGCACLTHFNACNMLSGFWAGNTCGNGVVQRCDNATRDSCPNANYGDFLRSINEDPSIEADHVFSFWCQTDNVLGYNSMAWGTPTAMIPRSINGRWYTDCNHFNVKKSAAEDVAYAVQFHEDRTQQHHHSHHNHHHHRRSEGEEDTPFFVV